MQPRETSKEVFIMNIVEKKINDWMGKTADDVSRIIMTNCDLMSLDEDILLTRNIFIALLQAATVTQIKLLAEVNMPVEDAIAIFGILALIEDRNRSGKPEPRRAHIISLTRELAATVRTIVQREAEKP
jgi:hypothetical protein